MKTIYVLVMLFTIPAVCRAGANDDASRFWGSFRKAVAAEKVEDVVTLTSFPFEVRGPVDSDPVVRYDRQHFPLIFRKLCSQRFEVQVSGGFQDKTMGQVIRDKKSLTPKDYLAPDIIRVHQFVFQHIRGKWLLVRAYLEE